MRIQTKKRERVAIVNWQGDSHSFTIAPLDLIQETALIEKHTSHKIIEGHLTPDIDFLELKIEKTQMVIKEWPCLDEEGNAIKCTDANKRVAYILNSALMNRVLAQASAFTTGAAEIKEEEKKT